MNETTNLNSELLSADARGRKHIPFAVFAVILIHIVLFMVLLIAAGCRAKARAKRNAQPDTEMLAQATPGTGTGTTTQTNVLPAAITTEPITVNEPPVEKTGPVIEKAKAVVPVRKAAQKASTPASPAGPTAAVTERKPKIYVVQAGDTVEKIAKMHRTSVRAIKAENKLKNEMLRPGQQLRVNAEKPQRSNEV